MIPVGSDIRVVNGSRMVEAGREGVVLSAYEYPSKAGAVERHYKVRFKDGPICVVKAEDVEGALGVGV